MNFLRLIALSAFLPLLAYGANFPSVTITGIGTAKGLISTNDAVVNVKNPPFLATGDGVTDDTAAIQAAFNYAWGTNNLHTELNKTVYFPPGEYKLTDSISVTNVRSAKLVGSGRNNTILRSDVAMPAFKTDGLWYSEISSIAFQAAAGHTNGVFDLDGNKAQDGSTIGVQGNTFKDCEFIGSQLAAYGLTICHTSAGYGQGSENLFLNCHFLQCTNAAVLSDGPNALQNTWVGGNVQSCHNNGIYIRYGSATIISMGFQNADSGLQFQTGFDLVFENYANAANAVYNCRSESLYYVNSQSPPLEMAGFVGNPPVGSWADTTGYTVGDIITPNTISGYLFQCTQSGTSGGSEPTWNLAGSTVVDGTVHWVRLVTTSVIVGEASVRNCLFYYANGSFGKSNTYIENCYFGPADWLQQNLYADPGGLTGPQLMGNTSGSPYSVRLNASTAAVVTNQSMLNIGMTPLLFSGGTNGSTWGDVGLYRNDGSATSSDAASDSHNVLGVIGSLGKVNTGAATGDDMVILGGIGATAGGSVRLLAQPSGAANAFSAFKFANDGSMTASSSDLTNTLAIRNGNTAQSVKIYRRFTDASNYERIGLNFTAGGDVVVGPEAAGSGVLNWLGLGSNGTARWWVTATGHLEPAANNTTDIGVVGVVPRNIYVGTSILMGTNILSFSGTNLTWNGTTITVP